MMTLIVLVSATFIYLFEEKSNIPSMPHALWLAVVTMTTVGYGDFFPTSVGGYLTVSVLTFISVVFLALPVGIVGHEFNKSWQSRAHMLLMTRVRKCLNKWGFNAGDVQMLIQYADVDGDGQLTLGEFVELIRQMRIGVSSEAAAELFTLLDVDYNGYVDSEEFLRNVFPDEYVKEIQPAPAMALSLGTRVVVQRGRSEGTRGVVLDIDRDAGCCKVAFDENPSVPAKVAIRLPSLDKLLDVRSDEALAEVIEACAQATSSFCSSTVREALARTAAPQFEKEQISQLSEQLSRRMTRLEQRMEAMDEAFRSREDWDDRTKREELWTGPMQQEVPHLREREKEEPAGGLGEEKSDMPSDDIEFQDW
eukprot:g11768.t2